MVFYHGCTTPDDEAIQIAREAANRQAEQNQEMARQNQRVAEAAKELVAANAQAHEELIGVQKDLRADQAEVGRQRDALGSKRKKIAAERQWDQLLAPTLLDFGLLLAVAAVLGFYGYLLIGLRKEDITDQALGELLDQELTVEEPLQLPPHSLPPPALKYQTPTAISNFPDPKFQISRSGLFTSILIKTVVAPASLTSNLLPSAAMPPAISSVPSVTVVSPQ